MTAEPGEPDEDAVASPTTVFSFIAAHSDEDPDSETSPMSKVSGRFSEDSIVSNCRERNPLLQCLKD